MQDSMSLTHRKCPSAPRALLRLWRGVSPSPALRSSCPRGLRCQADPPLVRWPLARAGNEILVLVLRTAFPRGLWSFPPGPFAHQCAECFQHSISFNTDKSTELFSEKKFVLKITVKLFVSKVKDLSAVTAFWSLKGINSTGEESVLYRGHPVVLPKILPTFQTHLGLSLWGPVMCSNLLHHFL